MRLGAESTSSLPDSLSTHQSIWAVQRRSVEVELHDLAWSKEWFGWKSERLRFLLLQECSDTAVHIILTGHYARINKVIAARMGK